MKTFEDYFSELQADMVSICLEYVEERAEKIQISMNKKIDTLNELKQTKEKNINDGSIRNGVSYLKKIGILENIATGVYRLNSYLFGFGKWEDIKKLRLTIEYKNNERTMVATETEKIE